MPAKGNPSGRRGNIYSQAQSYLCRERCPIQSPRGRASRAATQLVGSLHHRESIIVSIQEVRDVQPLPPLERWDRASVQALCVFPWTRRYTQADVDAELAAEATVDAMATTADNLTTDRDR